MMNFAVTFIAEHAALFIAALALWASWRANSHAKAALAQAEKVKLLEVQAEVLREIDFQHAKLGALLACTAEAAVTYARSDELRNMDPTGYSRVMKNIEALQSLHSGYDDKRAIAESSFGQGSVQYQLEILANIRRLTLHVQEDIEKERRHLEQLQQQVQAMSPNKLPS